MTFLSVYTHACDQSFVTSEYVTDKWLWPWKQCIQLARMASYQRLCNVLEQSLITTDAQAIVTVVTFGFEGTDFRCVVCGSTDYQMSFFVVNVVAKWS